MPLVLFFLRIVLATQFFSGSIESFRIDFSISEENPIGFFREFLESTGGVELRTFFFYVVFIIPIFLY